MLALLQSMPHTAWSRAVLLKHTSGLVLPRTQHHAPPTPWPHLSHCFKDKSPNPERETKWLLMSWPLHSSPASSLTTLHPTVYLSNTGPTGPWMCRTSLLSPQTYSCLFSGHSPSTSSSGWLTLTDPLVFTINTTSSRKPSLIRSGALPCASRTRYLLLLPSIHNTVILPVLSSASELNRKLHRAVTVPICSLRYLQCLATGLAHSKCLITIFNKSMNRKKEVGVWVNLQWLGKTEDLRLPTIHACIIHYPAVLKMHMPGHRRDQVKSVNKLKCTSFYKDKKVYFTNKRMYTIL